MQNYRKTLKDGDGAEQSELQSLPETDAKRQQRRSTVARDDEDARTELQVLKLIRRVVCAGLYGDRVSIWVAHSKAGEQTFFFAMRSFFFFRSSEAVAFLAFFVASIFYIIEVLSANVERQTMRTDVAHGVELLFLFALVLINTWPRSLTFHPVVTRSDKVAIAHGPNLGANRL